MQSPLASLKQDALSFYLHSSLRYGSIAIPVAPINTASIEDTLTDFELCALLLSNGLGSQLLFET